MRMKKNILSFLLVIALGGGVLTGCGEKPKDDTKPKLEDTEMKTNEETDFSGSFDDLGEPFEGVELDSYPDSDFTSVSEIYIGKSSSDNITIDLGATKYDEISGKLGYAFEDEKYSKGYIIDSKDNTSVSLYKDENSELIELEFWNLTSADIDILDAVIYGIEYDGFWDQEDSLYVSIAGVETGDSLDEVLKTLGTPDSHFTSIGRNSMSLTYYCNTDDCTYELEVIVYEEKGVAGFDFSVHPNIY